MDINLNTIEPTAKVLAATALSQSLSFCTERKYLNFIDDNSKNNIFNLEAIPNTLKEQATWIEVLQIGKPLENSTESCFTAMQKILYSCFLPKETQLLFLITGNGKENKLYLGIRSIGNNINSKITSKYFNEFIKGTWPGLQTQIISEDNDKLKLLKKEISEDVFENIYALTGIPSIEGQYKNLYPATIDKLMAGMSKSKHYAYFVVADPIENNDIDFMLYQCREMNGQAESLKSINVTDGITEGSSHAFSMAHTNGSSISESLQKKDFSKMGELALQATGLGLAASFFPAAKSVIDGIADTSGAILSGAAGMLGFSAVGNLISSLSPTKTTSTTTNTSDTTTNTYSVNKNRSQSLSRNIVNKHIESVSEHLFYHSKRLESGKAIGLWKVGVYLMTEKKSDIHGAALQLRSLLSGQESIFEPIRIHDISNIMYDCNFSNKALKEISLGQLFAPKIMINTSKGTRFNHPFGEHYTELKSVLTTKELSYLINFPLHSVPGISVIDSSPEFCMNSVNIGNEQDTINLGKILYGGSVTEMPYSIPTNILRNHTLVSGISGSGKTKTVQCILNEISNKIPFLIIEPSKTEYVDWAIEHNKMKGNQHISIYMPGCNKYKHKKTNDSILVKELKINPFEIVWLNPNNEPNVLSHIDRVKHIFASTFPNYDILPILIEDLIYTAYQEKNSDWLNDIPQYNKTQFPTLDTLSIALDKVIGNGKYDERLEKNLKACINTRINNLKRGWKGNMLNTIHSTSAYDLFDSPCVINLSYISDDIDKTLVISIILHYLFEYICAKADMGLIDLNNENCHHLTVIEEAHRVISNSENTEQPKYKANAMFANMIQEIKSLGEGLLFVEQLPTKLIPEAIKDTGFKLTHRLVSEDDCRILGESMGINKERRKIIPKLLNGQCITSTSISIDNHWIMINKNM